MRVIGIGIDIADPVRFGRLLARGGDRFRDRWFTPEEIARCVGVPEPELAFALHYAAKEAVWKALHPPSWRDPLPWRDIVILGDLSRCSASARLTGRALALAGRSRTIRVTGSIVRHMAVASAIVEGD